MSTAELTAATCVGGAGTVPAPRFGGSLRTALTAIAALVPLFLFVVPGASELLQYDRVAILSGEWWRLLSGHFTHWTVEHLAWDLAVFCGLVAVSESECCRGTTVATVSSIVLSALVISTALLIAQPEMTLYRGLSGIDSALFAVVGISVLRQLRGSRTVTAAAIAIVTGFAAKLAWEMFRGDAFFVSANAEGFSPVPLAHAVGAITGSLVALFTVRSRTFDLGKTGIHSKPDLTSATVHASQLY